MFSCCSFPTEFIRLLVVFTMLMFEVMWVTRKNQRAALIMAAGSALDLGASVLVPMIEVASVAWMTQNPGDPPSATIVGLIAMPMLSRLTIALHLVALSIGIFLIVRDLPDQERDQEW